MLVGGMVYVCERREKSKKRAKESEGKVCSQVSRKEIGTKLGRSLVWTELKDINLGIEYIEYTYLYTIFYRVTEREKYKNAHTI